MENYYLDSILLKESENTKIYGLQSTAKVTEAAKLTGKRAILFFDKVPRMAVNNFYVFMSVLSEPKHTGFAYSVLFLKIMKLSDCKHKHRRSRSDAQPKIFASSAKSSSCFRHHAVSMTDDYRSDKSYSVPLNFIANRKFSMKSYHD